MKSTNFISDSDFSDVPDKSGVYAWFYPMRIYDLDTYDSFFHRINYFLNYSLKTNMSEVFIDELVKEHWSTYQLTVSSLGKTDSVLKKNWDSLKNDSDFKNTVLELSFWNTPIYIGKADNLNIRINNHCNGSDFSKRFDKACKKYEFKKNPDFRFVSSLNVQNLLLSYSTIPIHLSENLEKVIQLSSRPNFSIK